MRKLFLLSFLTLVCAPAASEAAPIYRTGNECPADSDGPFGTQDTYTRQYYVAQATACMFTDEKNDNVQGSTVPEANDWLNTALAATNGWHDLLDPSDNWQGLNQTPAGFSFTITQYNNDPIPGGIKGTFSIDDPLFSLYDQFAIAVKDGGLPKFGIFLLPVGLTDGDWEFLSGGGSLSHLALFGRNSLEINEQCTTNCPGITEVPEPATLLLLGSGLTYAVRRRRAKR